MNKKQRAKMAILYKQGKISREQWEHFRVVKPKKKKAKKR